MFRVYMHMNIHTHIDNDVVVVLVTFQPTASIPIGVSETLFFQGCQERGWECLNALLLCGVHAAKWNMSMRMNTIIENPKTYPQYIMIGRRNRSVARGSNAHSLNLD